MNVKRLNKKPAPPRFGKKLTEGQKALATHICVDCGWVYAEALPFEQAGKGYRCPQCNAPKRRFVPYDVDSNKVGGFGVLEVALCMNTCHLSVCECVCGGGGTWWASALRQMLPAHLPPFPPPSLPCPAQPLLVGQIQLSGIRPGACLVRALHSRGVEANGDQQC